MHRSAAKQHQNAFGNGKRRFKSRIDERSDHRASDEGYRDRVGDVASQFALFVAAFPTRSAANEIPKQTHSAATIFT